MAVANEGGKNQSYDRYECPHYLLQDTDRKRLVLSKKSIGMDVCDVMCVCCQTEIFRLSRLYQEQRRFYEVNL